VHYDYVTEDGKTITQDTQDVTPRKPVSRYWINWSVFSRMSPATQRELRAQCKASGQELWIDFNDHAPKNSRISDYEEYEGEAAERGLDPRGFNLGS
jgi:hypothetical protein